MERGENYVIIRIDDDDIGDLRIRFADNFNSYWINEETDFPEKFTKILPNKANAADAKNRAAD